MPWFTSKPPTLNSHTLRAQKLDRKSEKARKRGDLMNAIKYDRKADKAARKGGWFS